MYRLKISLVNKDKEHTFTVVEKQSNAPNLHTLFNQLRREYGRCTGNMYAEPTEDGGKEVKCGWVFEGRDRYTDTREYYKREAWVEVQIEQEDGSLIPLHGASGGVR